LSSLQCHCDYTSIPYQTKILNLVQNESKFLQEKVFYNLIKLPILIKIDPFVSEVKLDDVAGYNKMIQNRLKKEKETKEGEDIFLYNPWEKDDKINFYWTSGSFQKIYVRLFNPLKSQELNVQKLVIIFEGNKPFSFPTTTIIAPNSFQTVLCNIKILEPGILNIVGIKYEVLGVGGVQFADKNGNGLFYNYENFSHDKYALFKVNNRIIKYYII